MTPEELAALMAELGIEDAPDDAAESPATDLMSRPPDPQTGLPVRIPSDPGFQPFANPEVVDASGRARAKATPMSMVGNAVGGALSTIPAALEAVFNPIDTIKGLVSSHIDQGRRGVNLIRRGGALNTIEGVGRVAASALPAVGPALANIGEGLGSALNDPNRAAHAAGEGVSMALAPSVASSVVRRAGPALRGTAENLAGKTMRATDDVLAMTDLPIDTVAGRQAASRQLSRTALDEGVLPGLLTDNTRRPRARMDQLIDDAAEQLSGPSGHTPINPSGARASSFNVQMDRLRHQMAPGRDKQTALKARDESISNPAVRTVPTAVNANRVTSGNVRARRGQSGVEADITRATARDLRREVGRAVPRDRWHDGADLEAGACCRSV
jgi:hypothetical protein